MRIRAISGTRNTKLGTSTAKVDAMVRGSIPLSNCHGAESPRKRAIEYPRRGARKTEATIDE
jgi:hypothetical protein